MKKVENLSFSTFLSSGDPIHTLQKAFFLLKSNLFFYILPLSQDKSQETPETNRFMEGFSQ
jgi:hypothetical protein